MLIFKLRDGCHDFNVFERVLEEFEVFKGFKSPTVDFGEYLMF